MKKIIFLLALATSLGSLKASHLAGAEISYKYIGDSTGIDIFTIETNYQRAEVSIYNRWGKAVFYTAGNAEAIIRNGIDQDSGQKIADGVYHYIISLSGELNDGSEGKESQQEAKTGALTIFTNGTNKPSSVFHRSSSARRLFQTPIY